MDPRKRLRSRPAAHNLGGWKPSPSSSRIRSTILRSRWTDLYLQ
ncbi:hypothetical protein ACFPRL_17200 [Pseudoclavibacter helvolus]